MFQRVHSKLGAGQRSSGKAGRSVLRGCSLRVQTDTQHEYQWINGGLAKPVMQVECTGLIMQGMHDQCANTDFLRQTGGTQYRILEQISAKPLAVVATVDRQAAKHHDRHGVGHVAANGADSGGVVYRPG